MALSWSGGRVGLLSFLGLHRGVHDSLQVLVQRRTVLRRRLSSTSPGLNQAVQQVRNKHRMDDLLLAVDRGDVSVVGLRVRQVLDRLYAVFRRVGVSLRRHQIVEDAGRAHDPGLIRVSQWNLDDLDAEQCRVGILRRRYAPRQLRR